MKKFLSCIAVAVMSFGISTVTYAADTLIARGGVYDSGYLAPGCVWTFNNYPTSGGTLYRSALVCQGSEVASYEYYNNSAAAPIVTMANYYATKKSGEPGAGPMDYAIYKKAPTSNCKSGAYNSTVYVENTQANTARNMTVYYNPSVCGGTQTQCPLNVKAVSGGYQLWCGL